MIESSRGFILSSICLIARLFAPRNRPQFISTSADSSSSPTFFTIPDAISVKLCPAYPYYFWKTILHPHKTALTEMKFQSPFSWKKEP